MSVVLALILGAAIVLYVYGRPPAPTTVMVPNPEATTTPRPSPPKPPAPDAKAVDADAPVVWTKVEERILELTNVERGKAGLQPLEREDGLCLTARSQSADMIARHFFDHVNPSGEDPSDRIERMNRRLVGESGENLWEGTGSSFVTDPDLGAKIVQAWMNSPHHRANILRPNFNRLGVGVTIVGDEVRATQNFSEEKAYLTVALPRTVVSGAAIDLSSSPAATLFDLEPIGKNAAKPQSMPIANARITPPAGRYRVRLYFSEGKPGSFGIYDGPQITVTGTPAAAARTSPGNM